MRKSKRLISILTAGILAGSLILPFNNVKAAAVITVPNKNKTVQQTVTKQLTVNDNLLSPQQSIFPSDRYSMYNSMSAFICNNGTVYNTKTGTAYNKNSTILDTGAAAGYGLIHQNQSEVTGIQSSDIGINSSTTAVTVSLQVRFDSGNFDYWFIGSGSSTTDANAGFAITQTAGGIWIDPRDGANHLYGFMLPANYLNNFYHITLVLCNGAYNNSGNAFYVNGVKQSMVYENTGDHTVFAQDYINPSQWVSEQLFGAGSGRQNSIAGVNIYNKTLSDTEVKYDFDDANNMYNSLNYYGNANLQGYTEHQPSVGMGTGGINGYNYLKVFSGTAEMKIACNPNTVYTLSFYCKIPNGSSATDGGDNYSVLPTTPDDGTQLDVLSANCSGYAACGWTRKWITFRTKSSYNFFRFRMRSGNTGEVDLTALKLEQSDHPTPFISYGQSVSYDFTNDLLPELSSTYGINNTMNYSEAGYLQTTLSASKVSFAPVQSSVVYHQGEATELQEHFTQTSQKNNLSSQDVSQFDSSVQINQDGYSGTIPRTGINWTANWITNRYSTAQYSSKTSPYLQSLSQWNYPSSVSISVYDSATNQNVTGKIGISRAPYIVMSANRKEDFERSGLVRNRTTGNTIYKDTDNQWIPWMSNSSSYYFGGAYSFYSSMPRAFHDYYGPGQNDGTWKLVEYGWGDPRVYSASEFGYNYWISDGDYGGVYPNRYARGVYLHYQRSNVVNSYKADYSGQIKLPDYIKDYDGTATYDGTLTKANSNPGYQTATVWTVTINYSGKEQAVDNPPTASFTCNSKVYVGENTKISPNCSDPDPWDSIVRQEWFYKNIGKAGDGSSIADYISTDLNNLSSFASRGRYAARYKVTDSGNSPYSGAFLNEDGGAIVWHDIKVYNHNNKPTALFSVNKQIKPKQILTYTDQSIPNNTDMGYDGSVKDRITEWHWQWSKDSTNWIDGQPTSFPSEGVYYIRLQVRDNGNYIEPSEDSNNDSLDDRLWSDWSYPQTVVVAENIKPVNIHADSIQVLDTNGNVVAKVVNGQTYRIKFIVEDDTDNAITGLFNTSFGLDVMDTDNTTTLGLRPHIPVTLYSKYFVQNNTTNENVACFDAYANSTHTIIETNDDDNALSITLPIENETLAEPTAQFTVSSPVLINQTLTYNDTSHVNQSGATIVNRDWKWCTDSLSWNNFGQPASFNKPGTYYIEEQVEDSNGLFSEWYVQKVNVIVPTPVDDELTVDQYAYKQDNNNYWVKPGDTFGITTRSYFPSDYGVYPSKTYLMLAKNNNTDVAAASQEWDTIASKYDFGSEFNNELTSIGNNTAAQSQNNNNNYLTALHQFTAKNDRAVFNLYAKSSYFYGMTEYSNSYTNRCKAVKVDGIAPGYDSVSDYNNGTLDSNVNTNAVLDDNLMLNLSVSNLFDKGSGVNSVYVKIYPTGQQNNAKRLSLNQENSNGYWDLSNIDAYALFKSADINIDFYAVDNVGNIGKIGTIKKELLTVHAEIAPYDTPDFSGVPALEKGQKAILKIYTTGYADTLAITFPQELVDKDSSLNKTLQITPQAHAETDVVFNVPRYIDEKQYTVKVLATNSVNNTTKESDPEFIVSDDILSGLRTGTLYDNP